MLSILFKVLLNAQMAGMSRFPKIFIVLDMYNLAKLLLSKKTIRGPIHSRFQDALVSRVNA